MKKVLLVAMIGATMSLASCSDKDEPAIPSVNTEVTDTEMKVSGTWAAGSEIKLDRHLVIPEGESLTIEPGVKVIVSTSGVGINHTPIEILSREISMCSEVRSSPYSSQSKNPNAHRQTLLPASGVASWPRKRAPRW